MTNEEILRIAMEQSAVDANCLAEDFVKTENKIVYSKERPDARRYLELPLACHLVSYGTNIVASVGKEYEGLVRHYIEKYPVEHCFETPNLYVLNDAFAKYDLRVCFMAEYFLPDVRVLRKSTVPIRYGYWKTRIFKTFIRPSGPMRCAATEESWTSWEWELTKMNALSGWRPVPQIVTKCGRLGWMCCPNSEGRELRPH